MTYDFDYFVIGAGSGGVRSARIASALGAKVGIAESTHFGGTCVNVGCIPKKIYSYAADYGYALHEAGPYGWQAGATFDWATLKAAKDKEINRLNALYRNILNINKVEVFEHHAAFKDDHTIILGDRAVTAENILIAVGGTPSRPDVKGAEHALTSDDMFALETLPEKIVILGAGYIALEFAHICHGLGRDVTIVHRGDYLLKGFDIDLQDHLLEQMKAEGIEFVLNTPLQDITPTGVVLTDGRFIEGGLVLAATGRHPNTRGLGLDKAGVRTGAKNEIPVDHHYATNVPHIFAVGDVTPSPQLTPIAIAQGHALANRLFDAKVRNINFDLIPTAVFSKPEIGTVGLTEQQASRKGLQFDVYKTAFRPLRHTITGRPVKTLLKLIVEKTSSRILGAHICGESAGEMIQLLGVALNAGATKDDFDRTVAVHPTSAEELVLMTGCETPKDPELLAKRG